MSRGRIGLVVGVVACAILIGVIYLRYGDVGHYVTGDSTEIDLIGVRPDEGDTLFDVEGRPVGSISNFAGPESAWGPDKMARDFVFRLPEDLEIQFVGTTMVTPAGGKRMVELARPRIASLAIPPLAVVDATLDRQIDHWVDLWVYQIIDEVELTHVDLTMRYYLDGERGPPEATFNGPFKVGKVRRYQSQTNRYTLTPLPDGKHGSPEQRFFKVTADRALYFGAPLIAYDKEGNAHLGIYSGGSRSTGRSGSTEQRFRFPNLKRESIARITFNERARARTFHNIPVRFSNHPPTAYPVYYDAIGKRLDLGKVDPQNPSQTVRFESPKQAIDAIDLLRGLLIRQAMQKIIYARSAIDPSELDSKPLSRIRDAARSWLRSPVSDHQVHGVQFGLWSGNASFLPPAFELLRQEGRELSSVAHALSDHADLLSYDHRREIAEILEEHPDPRSYEGLMRCLTWGADFDRDHTEVLLSLTGADQPWLWWPAIDALTKSKKSPGVIKERIVKDDGFRRKAVLALNESWFSDLDEQTTAAANEILAEAITPKFLAIAGSGFRPALDALIERLDRDRATKVMAELLGALLEDWEAYSVKGYSISYDWAVDEIVEQLNEWHGAEIGESEEESAKDRPARRDDWQPLAREAVEWYQSFKKSQHQF